MRVQLFDGNVEFGWFIRLGFRIRVYPPEDQRIGFFVPGRNQDILRYRSGDCCQLNLKIVQIR